MSGNKIPSSVKVFSTCPQSKDVPSKNYLQNVAEVAKWSEKAGCTGILVYTDNGIADPWLVSQIILQETNFLCPLVAVQPVYMLPYAVAKMAATFGYLYGRRIYLNMVAGGFKNDLLALNDNTPHDRRYDRLLEYTTIIKQLLESPRPVSFDGEFYTVRDLKMTPPLANDLFPGIFMSGSSDAGCATAKAVGATAIRYPKPPSEYENEPLDESVDNGIRVGIVTRDNEDEAWRVARERFPEDRRGQLTHQLAMKVSDSVWHKQLSRLAEEEKKGTSPYWLVPFENYKTNCPYLVGSYETVTNQIVRYINVGYTSFILDIPPSQEELEHIGVVFQRALSEVTV